MPMNSDDSLWPKPKPKSNRRMIMKAILIIGLVVLCSGLIILIGLYG